MCSSLGRINNKILLVKGLTENKRTHSLKILTDTALGYPSPPPLIRFLREQDIRLINSSFTKIKWK